MKDKKHFCFRRAICLTPWSSLNQTIRAFYYTSLIYWTWEEACAWDRMPHMLKPAAGVDRGGQAACMIGISTTQVNKTKDVVKLMYNSRAQPRKISFGLSKVHKCKRNMVFSLYVKIGNRNAHTRLVNAYIFFRNKVFGTYNCFTKNLATLRNPSAYCH